MGMNLSGYKVSALRDLERPGWGLALRKPNPRHQAWMGGAR